MKLLGMIGGTSWVSTVEYYRLLNQEINQRLGGDEAAHCLLLSLNFADLVRLRDEGSDHRGVYLLVLEAAQRLAAGGADGLLLCANTLHMFADELTREVRLPLVHIAEATGREIRRQGLTKVGLLGTRPTMEMDFYHERLTQVGVEALVPGESQREFIENAIMGELVRGVFRPDTRNHFLEIMRDLADEGAQGIIMGCTEIPLLLADASLELPTFDTLALHVKAAVDFVLQD